MAKRQKIHTLGAAKAGTPERVSKMAGKPHFHFCSDRECRLLYEDSCTTPGENVRCQACRGVRRAYAVTRDPQECCFNNCVQVVTPDDIERYKLGGPGPWYQCITCRRSHGWTCRF